MYKIHEDAIVAWARYNDLHFLQDLLMLQRQLIENLTLCSQRKAALAFSAKDERITQLLLECFEADAESSLCDVQHFCGF